MQRMSSALVAVLALVGTAWAAGPVMSEVSQQNAVLRMRVETCKIVARTQFVKAQSGSAPDFDEVSRCAAEGKTSVKESYDKVRALFGKKRPPPELAEWRLGWASVMDAARLEGSDTASAYMRRVTTAAQEADRATNRLEMALE